MTQSLDKNYEGPKVTLDQLSNEAHYALWFSIAMLAEPGPLKEKGIRAVKHSETFMSASDRKRALTKGLAELFEHGIVGLARNGLGEYEPAQLKVQFGLAETGLILRDGQ